MVKALTFLKRKAGMSVAEFQEYWRTRHREVVIQLPGVRRYVQSHVLPAAYAKSEPVHDGIAEVWADDTDALRAMTGSPEHTRVQADEAQFIDPSYDEKIRAFTRRGTQRASRRALRASASSEPAPSGQ